MRKVISMLCAVSLSAALLAGCGTSAKETTAAPETTVTQETASEKETTAVQEATAEAETAAAEKAGGESAGEENEAVDIKIMALKGPTAMGMVSFMDQAEAGEIDDNRYEFTIAAAIDEVTPKLVQGEVDIAAVPANMASVLYNNTNGGVQVLAVNTLGVLYIVESGDTITLVEDLRGKTIYASGKGATPEYALNYILSGNGIDPNSDVTIEWKSEHAECLAALMAEENAVAMLPQPFVTTAQTKSEYVRVALDLTKEWDKLQEGNEAPSALLTGVVVVRSEFAEENPAAVSAFLDHYKESVDYVNSNVEEAADLIEKYDIVPAAVAKKALPACNITFIEGKEMKEKLSGYLAVLMEQNEKSVGGALPGDDFYYAR